MKSGLYTIIEFDDNDKWFVIGETIYNDEKYNYLVRLTPDESDFLEEFTVVKCLSSNGVEYFDIIKDKSVLDIIIPLLIPNTDDLLKNSKDALKELMKY